MSEMGHYFRDEIVAQATRLAQSGYSTRKAAAELTRLFPGEDTPTHPTLVQWRKESTEADLRIVRPDQVIAASAQRTDSYSNDIKAEAVALVYETGSYSEAARRMAERYPERHPARQVLTRWFYQVDPEGGAVLCEERKRAFEAGIVELADKASTILYDALDEMSPHQVPIPAGISIDKGLRLIELQKRGGVADKQVNVQFNFFSDDDKD